MDHGDLDMDTGGNSAGGGADLDDGLYGGGGGGGESHEEDGALVINVGDREAIRCEGWSQYYFGEVLEAPRTVTVASSGLHQGDGDGRYGPDLAAPRG